MTRDDLTALLRPLAARMHRGHCWIRTQDGPRRIERRFTEVELSEHVMGANTYGLCPIAPGESTCMVACLDLDSHKGETAWQDMIDAAQSVALSLEIDGYAPHLFRSSGGHGIHIYLMWAASQDAYSVREMLTNVLASVGLAPGTKGVAAGQVEIFPKQNEVKGYGYGSMFVLPWTGHSQPLSEFLGWRDSPDVPVLQRAEHRADPIAPGTLPNFNRIKSALDAIPNTGAKELSYDEWRNIVFAVHHATNGSELGLSLVHEFSARSSKYDASFIDNRVWPYVRTDRDGASITEGSLFAAASREGWQDPTIADDFEACATTRADVGEAAADGDTQEHTPRFTFIPAREFKNAPPSEWIVPNVIPEADLIAVYGESGSGKSFWVLDLVQCIARGSTWRDLTCKRKRIAYIAAEGAGGFRKRVSAYDIENKLDTTDLFVLPAAPNFLQVPHVKDVIKRLQEIGPVGVVVVDTLARVSPGGAENSSEDMGKVIMHCEQIKRCTGAVVILIHHSGKDAAKGMRGWSGLRGAIDTEIEIVKSDHDRVATITKQKDGEEGAEFGFKLRQVVIGENETGSVTSCVVDHGAAVGKAARKAKARVGDVGDVVIEQACAVFEQASEWPTYTALVALVIPRLVQVPGARDQREWRVKNAIDKLLRGGVIEQVDGRVVVVGKG